MMRLIRCPWTHATLIAAVGIGAGWLHAGRHDDRSAIDANIQRWAKTEARQLSEQSRPDGATNDGTTSTDAEDPTTDNGADSGAHNNSSAVDPADPASSAEVIPDDLMSVDLGTFDREISVELAYAFMAQGLTEFGMADFIDARRGDEYEEGHIAGSFNIPPRAFSGQTPAAIQSQDHLVPDGRAVIIYCNGGDCDASHLVAQYLEEMQFPYVFIMTDGYPAWVDAGYPTEAGPDPFTNGGG